MSVDIRVPTTGNAGEDAVVIELRATVGASVTEGEVVAVLETAKASMDVEAPASGTVLAVHCEEGEEVAEHSVLFVLGEPGEILPTAELPSTADHKPATPGNTANDAPLRVDSPSTDRVASSPRARILAHRNGIDISRLHGSGPGGRVIVPDVLAQKGTPGSTAAGPEMEAVQVTPSRSAEVISVRGARKVTAQRMTQSLQESAQVTLNRYVAAEVVVAFSRRLRAYTEAKGLPKVGINDMVNFAVAQVLPGHQVANSHFSWDGIEQFAHVDLGIAVDTGTSLLVPVIRDAHTMPLLKLADRTRKIAERARAGGLDMTEMENGTFTVTNLGMFGVHWFTPVLNPPQSCILGVGALHQPAPNAPAVLPLSLTFDHRALDGAAAARCLAAISEALENIDALSAILPTTH